MKDEDYASPDDSIGDAGEQPEAYEYDFFESYDTPRHFHFNSDILEYRSSDNILFNSGLQKPVEEFDFKESDKWAETGKALHTSAEASNSMFATASLIANKNYQSINIERSIGKSEAFSKNLEGISFGIETYEYFKEMYKGDYAKGFSISFNVLLGFGVGAVAMPFGLAVPASIGIVKLSEHYKIGESIYEGINTLLNEGYSPESGVFWL